MKTIKQKIVKPFIWLIVITLLIVMLLFNIAMRLYSQNIAQQELKNTAASVQTLIRQQLILTISGDNSEKPLLERLTLVRKSLQVTKLSSSTEFVIVDKTGNVIFPKDFEEGFLNDNIVKKAVVTLESKDTEQIGSFRQSGTKYYTVSSNFKATERFSNYQLIFITNAGVAHGVVRIVNFMLFVIILAASIIGILITIRISNTISTPISELSLHFSKIGDGDFYLVPQNNSSKEIHELTIGINEMSKRLMSYDKTQKMFLQNASHEIKTPLMSIQGYAEGIAKGVFSDSIKTAEIICEESKRLNKLVEELLTLSRIENNIYEKELTTINLPDAMKDYIQKINGYVHKESKSIRLDIVSDEILVKANNTLLSEAVINIISNGIKYAKSEIVVSVGSREGNAIIYISDDGNGIPQSDLPHIFERFYKGKNGNFGLGLSIAKSAVTSMGGDIKAYNKDGAVFEIELPIFRGLYSI